MSILLSCVKSIHEISQSGFSMVRFLRSDMALHFAKCIIPNDYSLAVIFIKVKLDGICGSHQ